MFYTLKLKEKIEAKKLNQIKLEHNENVEGVSELFDELVMYGRCESYNKSRIYYIAFSLTLDYIDFTITENE